jgi:ParB family chromosome partitioning protein
MRHDRHFVEELASRMGEGIGRMVPVEVITSNQDQPRTSLGQLDDLVASIAKHGILEPLLVRRVPDSPNYELVSGERRFHAALRAGLTEVPCIELTVRDAQALEIALVENLQRKDLSAFEEAEGYRTLIDKYRYTHDQVADAVGRSRVTVTESLALFNIPSDLSEACRHADITAKGILLEIARMPNRGLMEVLIEEIVRDGLDRAAVRRRRHELTSDPGDEPGQGTGTEDAAAGARRPFVLRFRSPERHFSVSLSFRTEHEPEPSEVIAALEALIADIKSELED